MFLPRKQFDQGRYETEASTSPGLLGVLEQTKYAERWGARKNVHTAFLGKALHDCFVKMAEKRGLPTDRFQGMKIVRVDQPMLNQMLRERGELELNELPPPCEHFLEFASEPIVEIDSPEKPRIIVP